MKTKVEFDRLEAGEHVAKLDRVEDVSGGQYGAGYKIWFRADNGNESPVTVGTSLSPTSAFRRVAEQLTGAPLVPGTEFDLDTFVGRAFKVFVTTEGRITDIAPVAVKQ